MWVLFSWTRCRSCAGKLAALGAMSVLGAGALAGTASAASLTVTLSPAGAAPEFTPQVLNAQVGDSVIFDATRVSFAPNGPVLSFVTAGSCSLTPVLPSPLTVPPGTVSPPLPLNAPGTYFYYDSTSGGCSVGWTTPGAPIPSYAGKIVVSSPSGGGGGSGSQGAALTATVAVASQFKSVTISTNSEAFGNCSGGSSSGNTLGFPNGQCGTPSFNVTNNGSVPEAIDVQATNATPSDNGTPWTLMGAGTPGLNQYQLKNNLGTLLASTPTPDSNVSTLQPGTSVGEELGLVGPSSSSDPSSSFSTTATWTAL